MGEPDLGRVLLDERLRDPSGRTDVEAGRGVRLDAGL